MTAFDPAAATAAYMATMSAAAHAKATHYTQDGHWLLLWGAIYDIVVATIILKAGWLTKIRDGLQRNGPRPVLVSFVAALVYSAAAWVLGVPWAIYAHWWHEKQFGLTSQPLAGFLTEGLISGAIGLVIGVLFLMIVYWLLRRAPKTWPIWSGLVTGILVLFLLFLQPIFVEPLFNHYTPAPDGPVRSMVVDMGKQVGVPTDKIFIYNGSKQSNRYTANVAGLFGTARVALSDTMFAKHSNMAEIRGVVGHEMGHYVNKHILIFIPFLMIMTAIGGYLAQWLFPLFRGLLGARSVEGISDPAGLPVLMIVVSVLGLLSTPIMNTATRLEEADADHFSAVNFHEPDGLASALVKTIEYRASSPSDLEEFLFYDHPSVEHRVRAAMDWKAAHLKEAEEAAALEARYGGTASPAPAATPAALASSAQTPAAH